MLFPYGIPSCEGHCGPGVCSKICYKSVYKGLGRCMWTMMSSPACIFNLPTLKARRYFLKLCFLHTLLNGLAFMPNSLVDYRRNLPYSTRSHSYTLQVPFARTTSYFNSSFVKPPGYGMNYRLRSSHVHLLSLIREHVCFFTLNNTYTSFSLLVLGGGGT